jgi:hypothetical protein
MWSAVYHIKEMISNGLFVCIIHGRWCQSSALMSHSITCRTGLEYRGKQMLIIWKLIVLQIMRGIPRNINGCSTNNCIKHFLDNENYLFHSLRRVTSDTTVHVQTCQGCRPEGSLHWRGKKIRLVSDIKFSLLYLTNQPTDWPTDQLHEAESLLKSEQLLSRSAYTYPELDKSTPHTSYFLLSMSVSSQ